MSQQDHERWSALPDLDGDRRKASTPRAEPLRVAVIGAGMAGCFAARTLVDHGVSVQLFDKSRGVGGRMATRRSTSGGHQVSFDHGAQYFTVRDPRFERHVKSWEQRGIVAEWTGRIVVIEGSSVRRDSRSVRRYVGVPGMTSICKYLSAEVPLIRQTRIARVVRKGSDLLLYDNGGQQHGPFDRVVVAIPPAQAADILTEHAALAERLRQVRMRPCWAVMATFEDALDLPWQGAFINDEIISWAARGASKPGRAATETLIVHGSARWSEAYLEDEPENVATRLLEAFWSVAVHEPRPPVALTAHHWRYAIPPEPLTGGYIESNDHCVVACGDWAYRASVEGAFVSGSAAAGRVVE